MMCAGAGVEELTAGLRAGAVDYVNKPFQAVELLARIGCRLVSERSAVARTEELRQANLRLEALWSLSTLADLDDQAVNDFVLEQIVRMTGSR